jgi:iron complex outermembrane receptor protein
MRRLKSLSFILILAFAPPLLAQVPAQADTVRRDSSGVARLPELQVKVTRTTEPITRVPFAVGVLDRDAIQRGQQTVGIDEALSNLPGVVVANRYNFSLDQRISIRGAGSRSNFGVRGLKILLDGIPQTLPDGQSQLTNIDFADVNRAEVLRGASSSLYGNASGGVIAFETERAAAAPFAQRVRVQGGSGERDDDGFYKWQSWSSARAGNVSGTLSISQFKADGFRQHSAGEFRQLNSGVDYAIGGSTIGTLRLSWRQPGGAEPGRAHPGRVPVNPDSAAANNIRRAANKDVQQRLALGLKHFDAAGNEV